jgi:hypothetical protein
MSASSPAMLRSVSGAIGTFLIVASLSRAIAFSIIKRVPKITRRYWASQALDWGSAVADYISGQILPTKK